MCGGVSREGVAIPKNQFPLEQVHSLNMSACELFSCLPRSWCSKHGLESWGSISDVASDLFPRQPHVSAELGSKLKVAAHLVVGQGQLGCRKDGA